MRYLVLLKALSTPTTPPSPDLMAAIMALGEEAKAAGVRLDTQGLQPSAAGSRVSLTSGQLTAADGPFTESKELIAGYWIWQCASRDEAIEWIKRAPFDDGVEIELRQIFESDDFGEELTPELRAAEDRMRQQIGGQD